jgi:hypothetical protein
MFVLHNSREFRDKGVRFVTGINYSVTWLAGFLLACLGDWLLGWLLGDIFFHNHFILKTTLRVFQRCIIESNMNILL